MSGLRRGQQRGGKGRPKKTPGGSQLGKALTNQQRATQRAHVLVAREQDGTLETERGKGKMRSVTDCDDLEDFMARASLANTDFTATERAHMVVLHSSVVQRGRHERAQVGHALLRVPRRPAWTAETTADELEQLENESFLEWRRGLAELEEGGALLTPFERNLEVWRQLWRVLERSDLVVQIVDARNPLFFRCEDLERYAAELGGAGAAALGGAGAAGLGTTGAEGSAGAVGGAEHGAGGAGGGPRLPGGAGGAPWHPKRSLLVLNKADLLPAHLRARWAAYLRAQGVEFVFFSALAAGAEMEVAQSALARAEAEAEAEAEAAEEGGGEGGGGAEAAPPPSGAATAAAEEAAGAVRSDEHVYGRDEFLQLLLARCPARSDEPAGGGAPGAAGSHPVYRWNVGFVGYPNVGKSSTINALVSSKKVSVSSTPGKTKHFQTLACPDEPRLCICDCPGLVFPSLAGSRAQMLCDGVLPVDQMREHMSAVEELCARVPVHELERAYGLSLARRRGDGGGGGGGGGVQGAQEEADEAVEEAVPFSRARELLLAHGIVHSFLNKGGQPDESRSARLVLKDLINGRLAHWQTPPDGLAGHDELRFGAEAGGAEAGGAEAGGAEAGGAEAGGAGELARRPPLTVERYLRDARFDAQEAVEMGHACGGDGRHGGGGGGGGKRGKGKKGAHRRGPHATGGGGDDEDPMARFAVPVSGGGFPGQPRLPDRMVATGPSIV